MAQLTRLPWLCGAFLWLASLLPLTAEPVPPRNPESPYLLNRSSWQEITPVLEVEVRKAVRQGQLDIAVVLLDKLPPGQSPEALAGDLYQGWQIGEMRDGRGVLYLYSQQEDKLIAAVSPDLEDLYPNAFLRDSEELARGYLRSEHPQDFVSTLVTRLATRARDGDEPYRPIERPKKEAIAQTGTDANQPSKGTAPTVPQPKGDGTILDSQLAKISRFPEPSAEQLAQYTAGMTPEETYQNYLQSLEDGVNYPYLDVLTEGSRYMRLEWPKSTSHYIDLHRKYREAGEVDIQQQGDLAVVKHARPGSYAPILMHQSRDGKWRIDVTKGWAYVTGADNPNLYTFLFSDHPWMFAYREVDRKKSVPPLPDLTSPDTNLAEEIARLEAEIQRDPTAAHNYFRLGEIFYWDCYWISQAFEIIEKGLEHDPRNLDAHWLAITARFRHPDYERLGDLYEGILEVEPRNTQALWGYAWYAESVKKDPELAAELKARWKKAK